MCGRFALVSDLKKVAEAAGVSRVLSRARPGFNIAPGREIAVITKESDDKILCDMRWGIPLRGRTGGSSGSLVINARSETMDRRPIFREAFRRRRCLVVADGYYEWERREGVRVPWYIKFASGEFMGFAALYDHVEDKGRSRPACVIITTAAQGTLQSIHPRMPAILTVDQFDTWLDESPHPSMQKGMLRPRSSGEMAAYEVSKAVNSPLHDDPSCIEPVPFSPVKTERSSW